LRFDIVGIGNPVYDEIITPWSKPSGRLLSGCSTNACLAAKKLGAPNVGLVGCVGKDFEKTFLQDMKKYQIEANVSISSETGGFHLIYDEYGNRTLDALGIAGQITPGNFPKEFLDSQFLMFGPILGEVSLNLIQRVRLSTSAKLFLDPQGLVRRIGADRRIIHTCNRDEIAEIARLVDFIKPNEQEIETMTGETDPERALQRLASWGDAVPIVTLAERGSLMLKEGKLYRIPAYETKAIDPTGAGDVYAGSFITEFLRSGKLEDAALFASAAASVMVEQVGPNFQLPIDVVEKRRQAIRGRLTVDS
jgi:sugar/nucleoside kinase (ribokinase family)